MFVFLEEGLLLPVVSSGLKGMATQEFKFQLVLGAVCSGPLAEFRGHTCEAGGLEEGRSRGPSLTQYVRQQKLLFSSPL